MEDIYVFKHIDFVTANSNVDMSQPGCATNVKGLKWKTYKFLNTLTLLLQILT